MPGMAGFDGAPALARHRMFASSLHPAAHRPARERRRAVEEALRRRGRRSVSACLQRRVHGPTKDAWRRRDLAESLAVRNHAAKPLIREGSLLSLREPESMSSLPLVLRLRRRGRRGVYPARSRSCPARPPAIALLAPSSLLADSNPSRARPTRPVGDLSCLTEFVAARAAPPSADRPWISAEPYSVSSPPDELVPNRYRIRGSLPSRARFDEYARYAGQGAGLAADRSSSVLEDAVAPELKYRLYPSALRLRPSATGPFPPAPVQVNAVRHGVVPGHLLAVGRWGAATS